MKCAGSSVELALIPCCGDEDIITGSAYENELLESNFLYMPKNNLKMISEADANGNDVKAVEPIYHTHTTPKVLKQKEVSYEKISNYYHFSIVRNPFDAIVSYFWWTFYGPDIAKLRLVEDEKGSMRIQIIGREEGPKYDYSLGKVITPMHHDSDTVLRIKFQQFLESESKFTEEYEICSNQGGTVLDWFASLQNDFWCESVDYMMKYETLPEDIHKLSNDFKVSIDKIPYLKSSQRKVKKHYSVYYNDYTKNLVSEKFGPVLDKFDYKF